jgi:hypothetical protein
LIGVGVGGGAAVGGWREGGGEDRERARLCQDISPINMPKPKPKPKPKPRYEIALWLWLLCSEESGSRELDDGRHMRKPGSAANEFKYIQKGALDT